MRAKLPAKQNPRTEGSTNASPLGLPKSRPGGLGNAVKHFLGSYRRQTVVIREGGYLRPRSGERSYDVFAVNCSMNILNGVRGWGGYPPMIR